ncbi:hypothetical protein FFJ24_010380 [Pedobacter sp. KBS0701]|uniref:hypothetical protein n=1 Tax=Pedobacter sp. KBS0701 TaxID=2578106 RepID=UPI00110F4FAE|nr:hypothetical protein [Pedobacter sp. KBS0701]QDW25194.1 hypothetical protein FFJ24_010380 [Pedobacter sp. KBS0701]
MDVNAFYKKTDSHDQDQEQCLITRKRNLSLFCTATPTKEQRQHDHDHQAQQVKSNIIQTRKVKCYTQEKKKIPKPKVTFKNISEPPLPKRNITGQQAHLYNKKNDITSSRSCQAGKRES